LDSGERMGDVRIWALMVCTGLRVVHGRYNSLDMSLGLAGGLHWTQGSEWEM